MPQKTLCPKCHGQRTTACLTCRGAGKRSVAGIPLGNCKECGGTGQHRCDVCGGAGEVEPLNSQREPRPLAADEVSNLAKLAARTAWSSNRLKYRFGVSDVILLPLDLRPHINGRHQSHGVATTRRITRYTSPRPQSG
jgi:hypothetical protein